MTLNSTSTLPRHLREEDTESMTFTPPTTPNTPLTPPHDSVCDGNSSVFSMVTPYSDTGIGIVCFEWVYFTLLRWRFHFSSLNLWILSEIKETKFCMWLFKYYVSVIENKFISDAKKKKNKYTNSLLMTSNIIEIMCCWIVNVIHGNSLPMLFFEVIIVFVPVCCFSVSGRR